MSWPQITMIVLLALGVGVSTAKHGESRPPYNGFLAIGSAAISAWLLYVGGFFNQN